MSEKCLGQSEEAVRADLRPVPRKELAEYLDQHRDEIRQAVRKKLNRVTRVVCDSEEIASSVIRRLDELAHEGRLRPANDTELWGLIHTIAVNAAITATRKESLRGFLRTDIDPDQITCRYTRDEPLDEDDRGALESAAFQLKDSTDRQMVLMRIRGASHKVIAATLGISHDAARQRWSQVVRRMIEFAKEEACRKSTP